MVEHTETCELCGCKLSQQSTRYTFNYGDGSNKQLCMKCFYNVLDMNNTVKQGEGAE